MKARQVLLRKIVSADLALRDSAEKLFDYIDSLSVKQVVLDFSGIRSISRSFAQEYLSRKSDSQKTLEEIKIPKNIQKMFEVVGETTSKCQLVPFASVSVKSLWIYRAPNILSGRSAEAPSFLPL